MKDLDAVFTEQLAVRYKLLLIKDLVHEVFDIVT